MSSGSQSGSWRDQHMVAQETKHPTHLMNHERRDSVLDYDELASKMKNYQHSDGGLYVCIL